MRRLASVLLLLAAACGDGASTPAVTEHDTAEGTVESTDLLMHREVPAFDLTERSNRVEDLADVLHGVQLDDTHQTQLGIHVDHGTMGRNRIGRMRVPLTVLVGGKGLRVAIADLVLARTQLADLVQGHDELAVAPNALARQIITAKLLQDQLPEFDGALMCGPSGHLSLTGR